MSSSAQSSPSRIGSVYGKSGAVISLAKTTLSEQHNRLSTKHLTDLDLIDDLRAFIKTKCSIEKDYSQSLIKLANTQSKKYPNFLAENDSQIKTLYTAWKTYLEEMEKFSKNRLSQFEHLSVICDSLKQMRSHKLTVSKKSIDQHLKKMQEEVLTSISEIDKTRKLYFDEEHLANQARDKEEKIKKRKTGLFSSFTNLQSKKEKTSAHREATDIQSTQARNDYIMALAAGNAHLTHYYSLDLPTLIRNIDDDVLDKCRGFVLSLLESEMNAITMSTESIDKAIHLVESTSADFTNTAFLAEPQSACLREPLLYEFEACDSDTIDVISLEHNADIALRNEVQKWFTWFAKECRNLNRLSQQLIKCQSLLAEGHKTVEVTGSGPVDVEVRIDDIKQQIRKCEISKLKAKARLQVIKESGIEMEDYESFEAQVTTEIKQTSLDVDINIGMPLSRTPSLRSTNISTLSDGGRISSLDGKLSDDQQTDTDYYQTPEPEMTSARSGRPESSSSEQPESPEREPQLNQQQYQSYESKPAWGEYDPTQIWEDEPTPVVESTPDTCEYVGDGYNSNYGSVEEPNTYDNYAPAVDGTFLVGKICQTLYLYEAQSGDELSFLENERLTVIEALDKDWVKAQNDRYMIGFVPAAYLVVIEDAPQQEIPISVQPEESVAEDSSANANDLQINKEISDENYNYVRAIYDYTATSDEEISFNEGEIFKLICKSEDGWWTGQKDGITGHFPSMLVEELGEDRDSAAFAESGSGEESEESMESPTTPLAPPPSFAPPKPAYLTPHQVVIIQPTPEIESKPSLGDDDNNEIETNETIMEDNDNQEDVDSNAYVINPEFTLEKLTRKSNEENDSEEPANAENLDEIEVNVGIAVIAINVEEIETAAEEISEAITHDAICDAAKESLYHENSAAIDYQNDNINNNYHNNNEDSDYEDIK